METPRIYDLNKIDLAGTFYNSLGDLLKEIRVNEKNLLTDVSMIDSIDQVSGQ
jgi:hypothetical protein